MRIKKWNFPVIKAARYKSGKEPHEFENWVVWVRAEDLPLDFPLDPNARHPDLHGRVPRAIERTLVEEPVEFLKRNAGLCMVARACLVQANRATLSLNVTNHAEEYEEGRRGDGVLNGGHTYAVLRKVMNDQAAQRKAAEKEAAKEAKEAAKVEAKAKGELEVLDIVDTKEVEQEELHDAREAIVRLEVQVGLREEDLADISRARNLSTPVQEFSLRNLGNAWGPIKHALKPKERSRFAFMEGDDEAPSARYDVGDLVRLLVLFNSKLYPTEDADPVAAFTSEKSLITRWNAPDFEHILGHLSEFLMLHDAVMDTFPFYMGRNPGNYNGVTTAQGDEMFELMGGHESKYLVPISFVFPVVAALRVFLKEDGRGWAVDPKSLGNVGGPVHILVKDALRIYRDMGKASIAFFGRNRQVWETLRTKALLLRSRMLKAA